MELLYGSTRGGETGVTASQAVLKGLADDGGLYVPERIPTLDVTMDELAGMTYQETAYAVMKQFLTDYTEEELKYCISHAYDEKFDTEEIAPLAKADGMYFLELFHGKTIAFKDMALSILPYLMTTAAKKNHAKNEIVILTATSGDTGKAAMAGFADVPGTRIIVFYPKNGVSRVQELQMLTQKGANTSVVGIEGNFDDAQTGVKKIFGDKEFAKELDAMGFQLSSANSINIGRLVPQVVYYVYAYAKLLANGEIEKNEKVNVVVPTGNFGNILAAYFAKQMGVPFGKLICASNDNKVLYDFFRTGEYNKNRAFHVTVSPSMDILISSNLERLLAHMGGQAATKSEMESLNRDGVYHAEITEKKISGLPVTDGDKNLIGFLSDGDILRFLADVEPLFINASALQELPNFEERTKELMAMRVRDIAKKQVISVGAEMELGEVCQILTENHIKKAPVLENGKMIGIINMSNITKYVLRKMM